MPINSRDGIVREPTVSLSGLTIDVDKDWLGHVIKNLGAPVDAGDAVRLPVLRANMEYPLTDVCMVYLEALGKSTYLEPTWYLKGVSVVVDAFTDKAVEAVMGGSYSALLLRMQNSQNGYAQYIDCTQTASDYRTYKIAAGAYTVIAYEAVDLAEDYQYLCKASALGSTLTVYRDDLTTAKYSVTDTAYASGKFGYRPFTTYRTCFVYPSTAYLRAPSSPSPPPLAYFEAPVVGSGTPEDPFRVEVPKEVAWEWSLNPGAKKKYDLLKLKGFTDEEIVTLFPEVLSCKVNRLALTHSCLIKTDKATGKPVEYTAIVRVFEQPDRQAHLRPMLDGITALRGTVGVRELTRDEAIKRAKQIDPDLTDVDLVRTSPTDPNFKTILKDYIRHREALGVKRDLIDDKLMERYLAEEKGW